MAGTAVKSKLSITIKGLSQKKKELFADIAVNLDYLNTITITTIIIVVIQAHTDYYYYFLSFHLYLYCFALSIMLFFLEVLRFYSLNLAAFNLASDFFAEDATPPLEATLPSFRLLPRVLLKQIYFSIVSSL